MLSNQVTAPDNLILISKSLMMVLIGHLSALHADVWGLLSLASGSQRERSRRADRSIHHSTRLSPRAGVSEWEETQVSVCHVSAQTPVSSDHTQRVFIGPREIQLHNKTYKCHLCVDADFKRLKKRHCKQRYLMTPNTLQHTLIYMKYD